VAIVGGDRSGEDVDHQPHLTLLRRAEGEILLDGTDIRQMRQSDLRRHVGVVLQDPFIFAGTIASNIRPERHRHQRRAGALGRAVRQRRQFIDRLPKGYDEVVTERGSTLSVGQSSCWPFARAIAFNPKILLVLDEATSSVDTETEHLIQDALAKLMKGRTSIIIAHRLSTIQNADRINRPAQGPRRGDGFASRSARPARRVPRLYELQYRAHEADARA